MKELNFTEDQAREAIRRGGVDFSIPGVAERMAPDDPIGRHRLVHGVGDE